MIDKGLFKACLSVEGQPIRGDTVSAEDYSLLLCWTRSLAIVVLYEHMTSKYLITSLRKNITRQLRVLHSCLRHSC